jgi:ABC-type transporter Mla subunit MlaD
VSEAEQLSAAIACFGTAVDQAVKENRPDLIADADMHRVLRDALRLYAFKSDKAGQFVPPYEPGAVTATETVVAATGIIRAADMNLWDLAMWFNRAGSAPGNNPASNNPGGRDA